VDKNNIISLKENKESLKKSNYLSAGLFNYGSVEALVGNAVRKAVPNQFPFIASIVTVVGETYRPSRDVMCTGTLITSKDILTVESCLKNKLPIQIHVYLGNIDLRACQIYYTSWWVSYDTWALYKNIPTIFPGQDITMLRVNYIIFFLNINNKL
jgi:hypothetical protein